MTGPDVVRPAFDLGGRVRRVRELMDRRAVDVLLLSVGADLPYFTGYEAMPLERLTMLVLPLLGEPILVVPELEEPRVEHHPDVFEVRAYGEHEMPLDIVAELAGSADVAAIGDQTWAVFLLGLQERMDRTRFVPASPLTRELRMRKDPQELELLRAAAAGVDRVVERLRSTRFGGRTEIDLAHEVADLTVEEGHEVAAFTIVAAGPDSASPHHEATDRVIERGDVVVVDFGGRYGGYHSDTTRTFVVGEAPRGFDEVYAVVQEAQARAVDAVCPAVAAGSIDLVARRIIDRAGYGDRFIHRTGHGIGLEVHEHPYIIEGNDTPLEPGMTFSVEPGVYLPGRWGVRIEDIVAVTADGVERLNRTDRSPIFVE